MVPFIINPRVLVHFPYDYSGIGQLSYSLLWFGQFVLPKILASGTMWHFCKFMLDVFKDEYKDPKYPVSNSIH